MTAGVKRGLRSTNRRRPRAGRPMGPPRGHRPRRRGARRAAICRMQPAASSRRRGVGGAAAVDGAAPDCSRAVLSAFISARGAPPPRCVRSLALASWVSCLHVSMLAGTSASSRGDFAPRSGRRRCCPCQHFSVCRGAPPHDAASARFARAGRYKRQPAWVTFGLCLVPPDSCLLSPSSFRPSRITKRFENE